MRRHASASSASPAGSTSGGGRRRITLLTLLPSLVLVVFGALLTGSVSAAITHNPEPFSPLTGSGSGLTLEEVSGVAIDEATGNVFVTDGGPGHERVAILGGEGGAPVGLASPYEIPGFSFDINTANGLAFDNAPTSPAQGTLYVADKVATTVSEYTRSATTEKYEETGAIPVPNGSDGPALSVDREGNLYVSTFPPTERGTPATIYKFSPSGTQLAEYNFPESPAFFPVRSPGQVAVTAGGDLFVAEGSRGLYRFPADGAGEIDPSVFTQVTSERVNGVTIDPSTDHVFAVLASGREKESVGEFDASGSMITEFGEEAIGSGNQIAFDVGTDRIYVADGSSLVGGHERVNVFGPAVIVPTTGIGGATEITGTKANLTGSINPEGIEVTECFFEWGTDLNGEPNYEHQAQCEGSIPTDSEAHPVSAGISGLLANGQTYHVRLVAGNENGREKSADSTFVTAHTVVTEAATGIGVASAALQGAVRPEGKQYTECVFEYGLTTSAGFESTTPCNPTAAEIPPDFELHPVDAPLSGLRSNATYKFRLTATNSEGTLSGETLTFTTLGPPQISEIRASFAEQGSSTLEAKINPSGFGTSYRFEWGSTASYGHSVPVEFEPFIGSGMVPVPVKGALSGLSAGRTYHYRVVARSSAGVTRSPDRIVETLNSCGLPEGRCFELVSPRDPGPVARPGNPDAGAELHYQAAAGDGSLAYVVAAGFPDAPKGAEVLYHATRGSGGWSSTPLNPPITVRSETDSVDSGSAHTSGLSEDLSCGAVISNQPLTGEASTRLVVEAGGANLYRRNPDGSYTAITRLAPENPGNPFGTVLLGEYQLLGFSSDCGKVAFATRYRYPGVPVRQGPPFELGGAQSPLYEWDEGALRSVGFVPGPSGEVAVEAIPGALENHSNVVSADGSRVFFTAQRKTSPNPSEIGKVGVFVREDGSVSRDVSLSETSTPDTGATYQWASKDGSRVFFTANAGLTAESSDEGTDLYEYDFESESLTDLSVDHGEGGAQVGGFLGASEDGSHVYFAAQGQLVPGKGKTFSENQSDETYSLYGEAGGEISYAGTVRADELSPQAPGVTVTDSERWTSRVSPDGRYLLFETAANVTGYGSGGAKEAYLYDDAEAGGEATVCVSCPQDGQPPVSTSPPISYVISNVNPLHPMRSLVEVNGEARVFFFSHDRLASGGAEGPATLYEWSHGQVFAITTEPPELVENAENPLARIDFADASADGTDIYFSTPEQLSWEDGDRRFSVYDARVGGGFPRPPAPPAPCDPTREGSCQGSSLGAPTTPPAASKGFHGSGNVKEPPTNRCAGAARQARRLSHRAKRLVRKARKVNRKSHRQSVRLNRKARKLAKRAKGQSKKAKSCRKRQRANDNRRAGK